MSSVDEMSNLCYRDPASNDFQGCRATLLKFSPILLAILQKKLNLPFLDSFFTSPSFSVEQVFIPPTLNNTVVPNGCILLQQFDQGRGIIDAYREIFLRLNNPSAAFTSSQSPPHNNPDSSHRDHDRTTEPPAPRDTIFSHAHWRRRRRFQQQLLFRRTCYWLYT